MRSGIYRIDSPAGCYIGSAANLMNRKAVHFSRLRKGVHCNPILQAAWDKYGELQFTPLFECRREDLIFFEQRAINALNPRYNICPQAANHLGMKRSAEARRRMSAAQTGKKQSADTIAKRSASLSGRVISGGTRAKISVARKGQKNSEAAKTKMRGRVFSSSHRRALSKAAAGNKYRLGAVIPQETRDRISAKLKGRPRSQEAVAKHRATIAARHMLNSVDHEVVKK